MLGVGIATATVFICGALLFFSMMEEGKAEHFFSTETIAEYQKRQVEEILAMDTSIEYELKIRGIQVDKDIYIAWLITIRYSGYLPTDLFQKWVKDNTQRWNEERPFFWEDSEWRKRAVEVIKLLTLEYVKAEGGGDGNAFGKAGSWKDKAGIGNSKDAKILPKEAVEEKVKERRGSFASAIAKGGKDLARIAHDADTRLDEHERAGHVRSENTAEREALLDGLSGLRKPATGMNPGSDRHIDNNEDQVGTANCQYFSLSPSLSYIVALYVPAHMEPQTTHAKPLSHSILPILFSSHISPHNVGINSKPDSNPHNRPRNHETYFPRGLRQPRERKQD